jgi:glycosyltransferase involved in cell wall biosynthesis
MRESEMLIFSLVIPCFNEARSLPLLLERCATMIQARQGVEVLLVDNGSTDDSPAVLEKLLPRYPGCRTVRVEINKGYGFGILSGLDAAKGAILGWTHADMQSDPLDALRGLALFDASETPERLFVKGRRYGRPVADVFFTVGMSIFETALLRTPLSDINAQPTMFHRRFYETWRTPPQDFALDLFAYFTARQASCEVLRFPVRFGKRAHGTSHWNVNWAAKAKFIRRTVDYSLRLRKAASH